MSAAALGRSEAGSPDLWRWSLSFAAVLGLHALALAGLASHRNARIEPGEGLPAVMIDMSPPAGPVSQRSEAPPSEAALEPAVSEPVLDAPPDIPEPDLVPPPEEAAGTQMGPEFPLSVEPPLPLRESAATAPPPPAAPAPSRPKPAERTVQTKPAPKPAQAKKPAKPAQAQSGERQEARGPPAQPAGGQANATVPSASTGAAAASRASWQGALVAHLRRNLRPQGGQTGVASVRFAVDRGGRVLSASLAGSAGSAALDEEAVAVFRRSQPLPAPPSDVPGASFTFTVPIRFSTR